MTSGTSDRPAPLQAVIAVRSRELDLASLTAALGRDPDGGHDRGSAGPAWRPQPRDWSSWQITLSWPPDTHAGTQGLSDAVAALDLGLADRLATLASRGCDVTLSVVLQLTDEPGSTGFHLEPGAVRWLSAAGAHIDIDQYVVDSTAM